MDRAVALRLGPGRRLGRLLTVLGVVKRAWHATIYIVWDDRRWCPMACKVFASRRRAHREADVLAALAHPNIVRFLGMAGTGWLFMEFLEGPTLLQLLRSRPRRSLSVSDTARIGIHLGAALAHVHDRGFLHLDVKPSNVIVTSGRPVLYDFEIAQERSDARPTAVEGTEGYMAPEQCLRRPLSPATDVFGLGATLYETLTGRLPFPRGNRRTPYLQTARDATPLRRYLATVPAALEDLVLACLARDAAARPALGALLPALHQFITQGSPMWPAPFLPRPARRLAARNGSRPMKSGGVRRTAQLGSLVAKPSVPGGGSIRVRTLVGSVVAALVLLGLGTGPACAQRERFEATVGADYDQGDFGTSKTTRTLVVPFGIKYLGDRFDLGVTASVDRIDSEGGVILINETPAGLRETQRRRLIQTRTGDVAIKGRYYLLDDGGPGSLVPALSPIAKVSVPTSSSRDTDWTVGLEFDKQVGGAGFFLLGDVRYTFVGDKGLRDQPAASVGVGRDFSRAFSAWVEVDWRRAVVRGEEDAVELAANVRYKITSQIILRPTVFVGLTSGASDFGVGVELAYRFGAFGVPSKEPPERRLRRPSPRP
jgi:eukaryotic-like serine/threonine-protein kinase